MLLIALFCCVPTTPQAPSRETGSAARYDTAFGAYLLGRWQKTGVARPDLMESFDFREESGVYRAPGTGTSRCTAYESWGVRQDTLRMWNLPDETDVLCFVLDAVCRDTLSVLKLGAQTPSLFCRLWGGM